MAFNIIFSHFSSSASTTPLWMLIQGTVGTDKYFLIDCLKNAFLTNSTNGENSLLLLSQNGVATFHINGVRIHFGLRIPISFMKPLEGQSLLNLQEKLRHVKYILIDEMSFIGPKMLAQIDERLLEAFPSNRNTPFGGRSIILVGHLGQLPPVKDTPIYVGMSHGNALWQNFDTIVTLLIIFRQQGTCLEQIAFRQLLSNLQKATPTLDDWKLLMACTKFNLPQDELQTFANSMQLMNLLHYTIKPC